MHEEHLWKKATCHQHQAAEEQIPAPEDSLEAIELTDADLENVHGAGGINISILDNSLNHINVLNRANVLNNILPIASNSQASSDDHISIYKCNCSY
ncbi:MAG: hypothetical protein IMW89_15115 [Ktedonobacteraceae bacterium]|nr:hypothetical protein [Ktedonobacteraceae bacterium]